LTGQFDVILANPPYIPTADIARLQPEITFYEPRDALDGGADGLHAYRKIAPDLIRLLAPDGLGFIEVGKGQAFDVMEIFSREGLDIRGLKYDLGGVGRCLFVGNDGRLTKFKKKGWKGVPTKLGCSQGKRYDR
jgi:release factor glutamine methyltransferase